MDIHGRVAVVTGAAVGIGRALAERLAAEGASVLVVDIAAEQGAETVEEIRTAGGTAEFRHSDLREPTEPDAMITTAVDTFGGVDILINNAGGGPGPAEVFPQVAPERWLTVMEVNLIAPMRAIQAAMPIMTQRGGGAVINTGSAAGLGLSPYHWPEYGAAKAGLIRLTSTLADLAVRHNIRVNAIAPESVATERADEELAGTLEAGMPEGERTSQRLVPLGELVDAAIHLIHDDALAGRVISLRQGQPPWLLPAEPQP